MKLNTLILLAATLLASLAASKESDDGSHFMAKDFFKKCSSIQIVEFVEMGNSKTTRVAHIKGVPGAIANNMAETMMKSLPELAKRDEDIWGQVIYEEKGARGARLKIAYFERDGKIRGEEFNVKLLKVLAEKAPKLEVPGEK